MRNVLVVLTVLGILTPPGLGAQEAPRRAFLFKDARAEVAQARVRGEADILLVIAAMPGQAGRLAAAITSAGGTVQLRDDDVDYIRARVPLDEVESIADHPTVHSIDVSMGQNRSRTFALADAVGPDGPVRPEADLPQDTIPAPWPPVLTDRPLTDRYSPLEDLRASSLLEENPTYDGRGVTIAMIDMNPDMLLPELQVAKGMDGSDIPKVAFYETALDLEEEDDGRWLRMDDIVVATGGTFTYEDSSYTAPRDGSFRMALFDELKNDSLAHAGLEGDVNRDENPDGASHQFGVLWDESSNDVWVDTDQDLSFSDEVALTDYNERRVFGVFGTDDPETPVRESIGFGVQVDKEDRLVALNLGVASHASLVVGAAVGSRGEEGRFDGVAPGAQLASVSEGGAAYGQTEATIRAAKHTEVEVIYFEQSSYITRTYLLRDGRLVPTVIQDRLVEKYGPTIVSPTHNYPVLGAIDDIVYSKATIGIGGHESKDNFFMNHGVRVEHDDNLLITGGYGPMGDGGLKPDVISPSNYVSTAQGFVEGRAIPGLFQLPPGYTIAGGTSTATPTAAGSVALLMSAAKQAGIPYDAERIKWAVTRGARWVDHIDAYKQGNGVISVAGAWDILNRIASGAPMVRITSSAPVKHVYSHLLPNPHRGVGLYERYGWKPGDREERIITFTRTTGPRGPMTFDVTWAGNGHGTYSAPLQVTLPLNSPVEFPVTVSPSEFGVHTAHLTLDHPDVPGYAYRTLTTVVAPEPLEASNGFSIEKKVEVPRPGMKSFFYQVPEGVDALKVDLSWEDRAVSLSVVRPDTRQQRGEVITPAGGRRATQIIQNPMAGMWEIRLTDVADTRTFDWEQAKKEEPVPPTPATLTLSALATDVALVSEEIGETVEAPRPTYQAWVTNRMAEFTGGLVSTPVGSARQERGWIEARQQQVFELEVLPGSSVLEVRVGNTSDPEADLDVYVFDCTGEDCRGALVDADPVGDEIVTVRNPSAGSWKVVVDAASVPGSGTHFDYLDVVFNPAYGMVTATDMPQERGREAHWSTKAHSWVAPAAHGEGRTPFLALRVHGSQSGASAFLVSFGRVREGGGQEEK